MKQNRDMLVIILLLGGFLNMSSQFFDSLPVQCIGFVGSVLTILSSLAIGYQKLNSFFPIYSVKFAKRKETCRQRSSGI